MSKTFVDGLWGHGPEIFDAQNERLKTLDSLVAFFKEKSALDRYYSRALKKLSKLHLMESETPGSPLQSFLHGFRDLVETVSTNYEIMAAKEADQMLNPLHKTKTKLLADNKTLRRESQKFSSHLRKLDGIHKRTRHEARMLCRESIVARKKCDGHTRAEKGVLAKLAAQRNKLQSRSRGLRDPSVGPKLALLSRKMKSVKVQGFALAERSKNMKKEFDNADNKYVAAVKACREFRGKHDSTATTVLKGLEKTEGDRILALKESVRRYLKVESEMSKKLLVSYQSVAAIAESVDVSDELQCYVQHFATGKAQEPLPEYIHFPSHEDVVFQDRFDPKDYQKAIGKKALRSNKTSSEEACEGSLVEEMKTLVARTLENGGEGESEAKELEKLLQSKKGRAAFAAALNHHRNHGFDRKYAHGMELRRPVFDVIAKMMLHFLDHAHKAMDTLPAQLVMVISQTFFYYRQQEGGGGGGGRKGDGDDDDDGAKKKKEKTTDAKAAITKEKIFLQSKVKAHAIWKSSRFWEEAFFGSLSKALGMQSRVSATRWHTDSEQAEALDRQRKVLFGQLGAFAHNMLGFGMPIEPTLNFVQKICSINELGPEDSNMLLGIVHAAAKTLGKGGPPPQVSSQNATATTTTIEKSVQRQQGPGSPQPRTTASSRVVESKDDEVISIASENDSKGSREDWTAVTHSDLPDCTTGDLCELP